MLQTAESDRWPGALAVPVADCRSACSGRSRGWVWSGGSKPAQAEHASRPEAGSPAWWC